MTTYQAMRLLSTRVKRLRTEIALAIAPWLDGKQDERCRAQYVELLLAQAESAYENGYLYHGEAMQDAADLILSFGRNE